MTTRTISATVKGISANRALVLDGLCFARAVPLFPVERAFDLSQLGALRERSQTRIAWPVIFLKAYALVARELPALRQAYLHWPWPRLVEFDQSVAMLVVNRQFQGEDRLCWARFDCPDEQPLVKLQARLEEYKSAPVEKVFRQQVRLSRLPMPVRRLLYWWNLNLAGAMRARRLGTFTLSTLAGQGVTNRGHQSFLSTSLTYGPLDADGRASVTLLCDHRVIDGVAAAAALNELERVLQGAIAEEIGSLTRAQAA